MSRYKEYVRSVQSLVGRARDMPEHLPVIYAASLGRPITSVCVDCEDRLNIEFEGGGNLLIWDSGQSCCEHRYMTTDDDLASFVGAKLVDIEVLDGPSGEGNGDCHDTQFVRVNTTAGTVTVVTHNEHNGYYGGFEINSEWRD